MDNVYQSNHRKIATVLSIIPGVGQIYNKQYLKGFIFLVFAASFLIAFWDFIDLGMWGIVTLGEQLPRDNSIFLLVYGIISIFLIAIAAIFMFINLRDAYKNGQKRDMGLQLNTIRGQYQNLIDSGFPYLMLSPGFFLLLFVVILPIIFVLLLAFTNYDLYHNWPAQLTDWVGLENFKKLFTMEVWRDTFFSVFAWTIIWTLVATSLQIALGVFLAILVNQKELKGKAIIRTLLILPWAVPAFVTILIFSGMFNESFGAINTTILAAFGIDPIPWMTDAMWTRIALIMIQTWLGFPFIFVMVTGVLQAIPNELYEAATVDGASALQKFRQITFPLVMFSIAPILITQYTFNFNNFNVIFLFNSGGPSIPGQNAGGTDILISWIYNLTMTTQQYGMASVITMIMSAVVITIAIWQFRRTKSFQEEDMM
ncbi:sugar ABC transporter permease [Ornithinibacillus halophilus]|uniref:Carbohydrate ABC transporter membrane protein 1, CUT1 family n=1 Tax=Ornithinibacillus halophilus TaxID=930117 RepID=A0A1M5K3Q5_9BACI|nr:sugar ABC transporter permease [Ornithinibacillus halophilus]SHG47438.1 carbohydrate ABC transporter membrane protein 1, CUT1 family [Ornithinibacillus halophilus]